MGSLTQQLPLEPKENNDSLYRTENNKIKTQSTNTYYIKKPRR